LFAAALAIGFTLYVMRVGGDFMYARLLIPATPFYLLTLEFAVARLFPRKLGVQVAVAAVLVAAVVLTPYPFPSGTWVQGIANEREFYKPEDVEAQRLQGATLRRYFEGLPVRIAIVGSQARIAYYARPSVAIEAQTGLTDRWIAHQPLASRGRVGHEKVAPIQYLLSRKVDFVFQHFALETLGLNDTLLTVPIYFDQWPAFMVHWDPSLLAQLAQRGARFVDFPAAVDARMADFERLPSDSLRIEYKKLKTFYFDFVPDSARQARFTRLEGKRSPAGSATEGPGVRPVRR
jgi:hypothetical protein